MVISVPFSWALCHWLWLNSLYFSNCWKCMLSLLSTICHAPDCTDMMAIPCWWTCFTILVLLENSILDQHDTSTNPVHTSLDHYHTSTNQNQHGIHFTGLFSRNLLSVVIRVHYLTWRWTEDNYRRNGQRFMVSLYVFVHHITSHRHIQHFNVGMWP